MDPIFNELTFLKTDQIKTNHDDTLFYGKDWTTYFDIKCRGVLFPKSTNEVVEIVKWARKNKISLVPSGGRTGLSGGACATQNEVVVSFEKMNKVLSFSPIDQTVLVEAGMVTEELQQLAKDNGLYFPVDFAARGSSQVGGNVATNAGGIKVVRYGMTRQWVVGLTVVTGRGDVIKINSALIKNATGPNLLSHFIGSEGIYGFITEVEFQLTTPPVTSQTLLLKVPSLESIMNCYQEFRTKTVLQAFEFFSDQALSKVLTHKNILSPFDERAAFYIVLEVEAPSESSQEQIMNAFETCLENSWILDGLLAQNSDQTKLFWSYREDISESLAPFSPYKNDVAVRISKVPQFLNSCDELLKKHYPTWEVIWFGHIGDGNLHINILRPSNFTKEAFVLECQKVDQLLFKVVSDFEGAISAEHGVGLTKKPFLHYSKSPEEIQVIKHLKTWYDPDGIINPGKVIDI